MAKEPQAPAEPELTTVTVYPDIRRELKTIADYHGKRMAEVLEQFGGPGIHREFKRVVEAMHRDLGGEGG